MNNYDKLNELFADKDFVETIKNLDSMSDIYTAVKRAIPGVTEDELTAYLTAVSEKLQSGEMTVSELEKVSGGFGWAALGGAIVVAGGVVALINGCYDMGENLGKFIGNLKK